MHAEACTTGSCRSARRCRTSSTHGRRRERRRPRPRAPVEEIKKGYLKNSTRLTPGSAREAEERGSRRRNGGGQGQGQEAARPPTGSLKGSARSNLHARARKRRSADRDDAVKRTRPRPKLRVRRQVPGQPQLGRTFKLGEKRRARGIARRDGGGQVQRYVPRVRRQAPGQLELGSNLQARGGKRRAADRPTRRRRTANAKKLRKSADKCLANSGLLNSGVNRKSARSPRRDGGGQVQRQAARPPTGSSPLTCSPAHTRRYGRS